LVIIKSTITPDVIDRIYQQITKEQADRFAYNPEFLTEKNAKADFVSAKFHVVGGTPQSVMEVIDIYEIFSACESNDYHRMTAYEASFVKYTINSFLSTKITFFNQLYDLCEAYDVDYQEVSELVSSDHRIGISHTDVTLARGWGGHCFPKDTSALIFTAENENVDLSVLKEAINYNNKIRS